MTDVLTDDQLFELYRSHYNNSTREGMPKTYDRIRRGFGHYNRLVQAGWTIEPPKPRYYVEKRRASSIVRNRNRNHSTAASFWEDIHPNAHEAARIEADRLNDQEQST